MSISVNLEKKTLTYLDGRRTTASHTTWVIIGHAQGIPINHSTARDWVGYRMPSVLHGDQSNLSNALGLSSITLGKYLQFSVHAQTHSCVQGNNIYDITRFYLTRYKNNHFILCVSSEIHLMNASLMMWYIRLKTYCIVHNWSLLFFLFHAAVNALYMNWIYATQEMQHGIKFADVTKIWVCSNTASMHNWRSCIDLLLTCTNDNQW